MRRPVITTSETCTKVAQEIRVWRAKTNLNQEEFGKKTGLSLYKVGRMEANKQDIGLTELEKMAAVAGLKPVITFEPITNP